MLIALLLVFAFTQCKKENDDYLYEVNDDEETKEVPVTFAMPINQSRSDFSNILPFGDILWGNDNNLEYIYIGIDSKYLYYDQATSTTKRVGELFELVADVTESKDSLFFRGMIPQNLLYTGQDCCLYYFGNNGNGLEGSNVTNIYDTKYPDCLIGKTISFAKQTGDARDVGDFHLASVKVYPMRYLISGGIAVKIDLLVKGPFENKMSLALLDLEGETTLGGSAAALNSYTIKWVEDKFVEFYEYANDPIIDVTNNVGEKSLIALLPQYEPVTLECNKGKYTFRKGLPSNMLFIGNMGHNLGEATPLPWGGD